MSYKKQMNNLYSQKSLGYKLENSRNNGPYRTIVDSACYNLLIILLYAFLKIFYLQTYSFLYV